MTRSDAAGSRIVRLNDLLGLPVEATDGRALGHVNDVRLSPGRAVHGVRSELVIDGLIVADRHAGSLLGYDRRAEQGPWLIRLAVRALHRNAGYAQWDSVREIIWGDDGKVVLTVNRLDELRLP
jgi:PRC-barrel domain